VLPVLVFQEVSFMYGLAFALIAVEVQHNLGGTTCFCCYRTCSNNHCCSSC
jgi:hypothetical protein